MARTTENDSTLRSEMNEVIASYNEGALETVASRLSSIWERFFSSQGSESTDTDILALMWELLVSMPVRNEPFLAEVMGALAGLQTGPLIAKLDDSSLNEKSRYLLKFKKNITSQSGEDGIIEKIFSLIGEQNQWCIEFGAYDGKLHSNTYTLVAEKGWNGVMIEGDSDRFDELQETFDGNPRVHMFRMLVGFEDGLDSLDYILSQSPIPNNPDLVVIDIDGTDWHVWHSLKDYRPRVIVIEFNPTVPNDVMFVQSREQNEAQGCSLRALVALGNAKGYELACVTRYNGIFVVAEEFEKLGIKDNSIGAMYSPMMDGRIFHGYDSKIFTAGMPALNWAGTEEGAGKRKIRCDELQLPRYP